MLASRVWTIDELPCEPEPPSLSAGPTERTGTNRAPAPLPPTPADPQVWPPQCGPFSLGPVRPPSGKGKQQAGPHPGWAAPGQSGPLWGRGRGEQLGIRYPRGGSLLGHPAQACVLPS